MRRSSFRNFGAIGLFVMLAVSSAPAAAQDAAPAATPAPAAAPAAAPAGATAAAPAEEHNAGDDARFRWAVHAAAGPWLVPDRTGGGGGVGLQLGAQINDMIGVYYAGTFAVGVAGSDDASGAGASAGAFIYTAPVIDFTFARMLQLGIGPSIDILAFGSADVKTPSGGALPSSSATALGGTFIGVQTRVGLALGRGDKPGKKGAFMLGLEVHPTFASDVVPISAFITLGGGKF